MIERNSLGSRSNNRNRISSVVFRPTPKRIEHDWSPQAVRCLRDTDWGGPVWDVGASLGNYTWELAKRHEVYAFQGNPALLYDLASSSEGCDGFTLVPFALTLDGKPSSLPHQAKFATLSVSEALRKFGRPGVILLDTAATETGIIESPLLTGITLLVESHQEFLYPTDRWTEQKLDATHSMLTPK